MTQEKGHISILQGKILEGSMVHTGDWSSYDELVVNGDDYYRAFQCKNELARDKSYINSMEAFWSFAKRRCVKFNGLRGDVFLLRLRECAV
jgi:transposase-like protein